MSTTRGKGWATITDASKNSGAAATATLMPLLQGIISNQYLSGTASPTDPTVSIPSSLNLFSGMSVPHMPFFVEMVQEKLPFANSPLSMESESETTYTFDRLGEYVGLPQMVIVAPALITYTAATTTSAGVATGGDQVRFLVDDLHHSRHAIRTAGESTANLAYTGTLTLYQRMFKLSAYISALGDTNPTFFTDSFTAPTAFKRGRDFFPAEDAMCSYCKFAPLYLLKETVFSIQGAQQDIFGPAFLLAWHRIWASAESVPQDELIHGSEDPSQLRVWSAMSQRHWVVTLPIWWGVGGFAQYFALRALNNHDVTFDWKIAPLKSIIVGSNSHVSAINGVGFQTAAASGTGTTFLCRTTDSGTLPVGGLPIVAHDGVLPAFEVNPSHFNFYFRFHRVWMSPDMRRSLHSSKGTRVCVLHNMIANKSLTAIAEGANEIAFQIAPKLSTAAWIFAAVRGSMKAQNKWLNMGGPRSPLYAACGETGEGMQLVESVKASLKNSTGECVFSDTGFYLNKMAPHTFAARTRIPDGMYLKNFGIGSPYSLQKRGFINMSALGDIDVTVTLSTDATSDLRAVGGVQKETVQVYHLAYTYCTFSWAGGMGGKDWQTGTN